MIRSSGAGSIAQASSVWLPSSPWCLSCSQREGPCPSVVFYIWQDYVDRLLSHIMDAASNATHSMPAYSLSGGRASPRKGRKSARKIKTRSSPKKPATAGKIYVGPNGGKYYLRKGRKIYI